MSNQPDPGHMTRFCRDVLPGILSQACGVDAPEALSIGEDVLDRALAFAVLDERAQRVVMAPFVEEVVDHQPRSSSLELKAAVTVVVRNSRLEEAHASGLVEDGGIRAITTAAAGPLSHLMAAGRRQLLPVPEDSPFAELSAAYPRAWACLDALVEAISESGRQVYTVPDAPMPAMPTAAEHVTAPLSRKLSGQVIFSAIDPRFDQRLVETINTVTTHGVPLWVCSLSRLSRNSGKLLRVVELLLAAGATVVTTNYMLRAHDVWVRRGPLVKPDSCDPNACLEQLSGLSGAHRKTVLQIQAGMAPDK